MYLQFTLIILSVTSLLMKLIEVYDLVKRDLGTHLLALCIAEHIHPTAITKKNMNRIKAGSVELVSLSYILITNSVGYVMSH